MAYCSYGVWNCPTCLPAPSRPLRAEAVAPVSRTMPRSQAFLDLRATMARPTRPADPIVTRRSQASQARMDRAAAAYTPPPVERYTPPLAPPVERTAPVARESIRFLSVPYREKDAAKSLGARWHKFSKRWYVPAGMDRAPFARWMDGMERLDVAPVAAVAPPPPVAAPVAPPPAPVAAPVAPVAAPVPVAAWPTRQAQAEASTVAAAAAAAPVVTYDDLMAALAFAKGQDKPKAEPVMMTVEQAAEKARHA